MDKKDLEALVNKALAQGWRVRKVGGVGFMFLSPNPNVRPVSGWVSSDVRALKNLTSALKRGGLKLDGLSGYDFGLVSGMLNGGLFGY